ncbi:MAG: septum formation protein Maf [Chloroflexi bacterium]|nr:septum formation protein Maf [Chloroflexota bacterium]
MSNNPSRTIMLASASPWRRELLALTGLRFEQTPVDIDETPHPGEAANTYTARLSQEKAAAAVALAMDDVLVLAADTTVADGDLILGKPATAVEARDMLTRLRGRKHQVYTAVTLVDTVTGQQVTEVATTDVPMRAYSDAEIEAYIASGDPFDKAGGYAIQHAGFHPANLTSGCYANVMGLPLCHLVRVLHRFGIAPTADVPLRCQQFHPYDCDVTSDILTRRR